MSVARYCIDCGTETKHTYAQEFNPFWNDELIEVWTCEECGAELMATTPWHRQVRLGERES